jgi:ribosomal protein S18 acetylase RimI-like enzyme
LSLPDARPDPALIPLTVRAATEADAGPVLAIWNDPLALAATGGRGHPDTDDDYRRLLRGSELTIVERAGAIQGTLALLDPAASEGDPADGEGSASGSVAREGELEITRLTVLPRARRDRIARLLLACAHGEAARRGARALVVWTHSAQFEAQDIYLSLGYRRLRERDTFDGGRARSLVYGLRLGAGSRQRFH